MTRTSGPGAADTTRSASLLQLRTRGGRAILVDTAEGAELSPDHLGLPPMLVEALREWAGVAERVVHGDRTGRDRPGGNPGVHGGSPGEAGRMVTRRGRQLAARLAVESGAEIDYVDPLTGAFERISGERVTRATRTLAGHRGAPVEGRGVPAEPTPWATGLTVSAVLAAIVTVCLVVVSSGLAEVSVLLAVAVNVAVAAGFAPSIWLGRRVPVWRWVAFGTAGGIGLAWVALLLGLLG